jgi:glucose/arabinose dehydrogenase
VILIGVAVSFVYLATGTASEKKAKQPDEPSMRDRAVRLELVTSGLDFPTTMAFLDANNILVTQKNDGELRLVSNGEVLKDAILRVDVAKGAEQGLLGIAITKDGQHSNITTLYLYLTERIGAGNESGMNASSNRIYSYQYDQDSMTLTDKKLVLDLPGDPAPFHNGGKIAIGPHDGYLYAVIGDLNNGGGMLDNTEGGRPPDDQSVIFRVDRQTGLPVNENPFYRYSGTEMANLTSYYAYGIRNGFGIDFDPVSNRLWMTENGPDFYDEINLLIPGFNIGWHVLTGPMARSNATVSDLVMFEGATYQDPVFSVYHTVGMTDIEFYDSKVLGQRYENNIFVGDVNNGNLYFFRLNENRTGLSFDSSQAELFDLVADPSEGGKGPRVNDELESVIIGEGFTAITDIETGPDGYLYILTYLVGKIYRIVPS